MRRLTAHLVLVLALGLAGAACDPQTPNVPTTPTTPTAPTTESFTGSLTINGAVVFPFVTTTSGFVQATLKTLAPDVDIKVGLALGTWNGITCQVVLDTPSTGQGITVTGSVAAAAALCVRIYDVGQLTQTNTFELTVIHP